MKNWIALIACSLSILPHTLRADSALPPAEVVERLNNTIAVAPAPVEAAAETPTVTPAVVPAEEQAPKQVGIASVDSANTGKTSTALKYTLAATAIAIAVTALILVARHGGHHGHHVKHHD